MSVLDTICHGITSGSFPKIFGGANYSCFGDGSRTYLGASGVILDKAIGSLRVNLSATRSKHNNRSGRWNRIDLTVLELDDHAKKSTLAAPGKTRRPSILWRSKKSNKDWSTTNSGRQRTGFSGDQRPRRESRVAM